MVFADTAWESRGRRFKSYNHQQSARFGSVRSEVHSKSCQLTRCSHVKSLPAPHPSHPPNQKGGRLAAGGARKDGGGTHHLPI